MDALNDERGRSCQRSLAVGAGILLNARAEFKGPWQGQRRGPARAWPPGENYIAAGRGQRR
eukprot:13090882-Alexandrium_andersonii.AAC.1